METKASLETALISLSSAPSPALTGSETQDLPPLPSIPSGIQIFKGDLQKFQKGEEDYLILAVNRETDLDAGDTKTPKEKSEILNYLILRRVIETYKDKPITDKPMLSVYWLFNTTLQTQEIPPKNSLPHDFEEIFLNNINSSIYLGGTDEDFFKSLESFLKSLGLDFTSDQNCPAQVGKIPVGLMRLEIAEDLFGQLERHCLEKEILTSDQFQFFRAICALDYRQTPSEEIEYQNRIQALLELGDEARNLWQQSLRNAEKVRKQNQEALVLQQETLALKQQEAEDKFYSQAIQLAKEWHTKVRSQNTECGLVALESSVGNFYLDDSLLAYHLALNLQNRSLPKITEDLKVPEHLPIDHKIRILKHALAACDILTAGAYWAKQSNELMIALAIDLSGQKKPSSSKTTDSGNGISNSSNSLNSEPAEDPEIRAWRFKAMQAALRCWTFSFGNIGALKEFARLADFQAGSNWQKQEASLFGAAVSSIEAAQERGDSDFSDFTNAILKPITKALFRYHAYHEQTSHSLDATLDAGLDAGDSKKAVEQSQLSTRLKNSNHSDNSDHLDNLDPSKEIKLSKEMKGAHEKEKQAQHPMVAWLCAPGSTPYPRLLSPSERALLPRPDSLTQLSGNLEALLNDPNSSEIVVFSRTIPDLAEGIPVQIRMLRPDSLSISNYTLETRPLTLSVSFNHDPDFLTTPEEERSQFYHQKFSVNASDTTSSIIFFLKRFNILYVPPPTIYYVEFFLEFTTAAQAELIFQWLQKENFLNAEEVQYFQKLFTHYASEKELRLLEKIKYVLAPAKMYRVLELMQEYDQEILAENQRRELNLDYDHEEYTFNDSKMAWYVGECLEATRPKDAIQIFETITQGSPWYRAAQEKILDLLLPLVSDVEKPGENRKLRQKAIDMMFNSDLFPEEADLNEALIQKTEQTLEKIQKLIYIQAGLREPAQRLSFVEMRSAGLDIGHLILSIAGPMLDKLYEYRRLYGFSVPKVKPSSMSFTTPSAGPMLSAFQNSRKKPAGLEATQGPVSGSTLGSLSDDDDNETEKETMKQWDSAGKQRNS